MPSNEAILRAALKTIPPQGMGHPSDKKTVVWTFKILKKHGIPIDTNVVRQTMLDAGMLVDKANEIQEVAERVSNGGRFQGIGQKAPLRDDIFEQWKARALEESVAVPESMEMSEEQPDRKSFYYTVNGTRNRALAFAKAARLAVRSGWLTVVITQKSNLRNYKDIFSESAIKGFEKNGTANFKSGGAPFGVDLVTANKYDVYRTKGKTMLILDCRFDVVEKALYNDQCVEEIIYVPWTADEFEAAQKIPYSIQI